MTVRHILDRYYEGTSEDVKPTGVIPTSYFRETDTYALYKTFDGDTWVITDWGIDADVEAILLEMTHTSILFPNLATDIDLTCTVTAGTSKAFGAWAELIDSGANKLSTIVESYAIHISALRVRGTSAADKLYVLEIGYGLNGESVTCVDPHDFGSGTKKIDSDEHSRFRPLAIPKGQKVYGRMKCETDEATANIVLRYHYE